jgi:tetratricopeptide (TPR) repeat protein
MKTANRFLSLASAGALIVIFATAASAQTARLQGELLGTDGLGLQGVVINLERQDTGGNNTYAIETNDRGYFVHLSVAPGDYQITFRANDKQYAALARIGVGDVQPRLDLSKLTYEGDEFSRVSGIVERVVRDIREMSGTATLIRAPANDEERLAREEAANKATAVREAFDAGRAAMVAGDYDEAISQFSIAAAGDTTQHVIFGNLGVAYERSEMWEEALSAYNQAQTTADFQGVAPEEVNYFNNLSLANAMNGNVDQAIANAEKAAVIDPGGAGQSFYNIGAVLTNRGDLTGSIQAFERAVEINPGMAEGYYQIALAKFGTEATIPEAIPLLEKYLELSPEGTNAEAARGLLDFARSSQ